MLSWLNRSAFGLLAMVGGLWVATAILFHVVGTAQAGALLALFAGLVLAWLGHRRGALLGWAALGVGAIAVALWYQTYQPSADRDWAPDVARGVGADRDGEMVTLRNIRDFEWTSVDTATERWITQTYDLGQLQSVDMITSIWGNPNIAHLLVSFGFKDAPNVVFSVEIRRELGEVYSTFGGFFRQFELVLIAATERDIVQLRTTQREEQVSLYPTDLTPAQLRDFFLAYVALAQNLEAEPRFYNTLTANCTTVVFGLARAVNPDLPLDPRVVLSGGLPEYVDALGLLPGDMPIDERRTKALITPRAQTARPQDDFSAVIRAQSDAQ
ncbi:DUF4105 domain-containing protein [Roseovarius sp. LXJ103]|nr:DUF4105 domain-containing protein [Roseovarius carneus]PWE37336.1 hypothetical protein DD563_10685 [Pelagicola sp. LXJ1103]